VDNVLWDAKGDGTVMVCLPAYSGGNIASRALADRSCAEAEAGTWSGTTNADYDITYATIGTATLYEHYAALTDVWPSDTSAGHTVTCTACRETVTNCKYCDSTTATYFYCHACDPGYYVTGTAPAHVCTGKNC
jgi:hypothetical protein